MFSFIVVLFNFPKYLRDVLVISAFRGFVFRLCKDFNWRNTGSKFWYFLSKSVVRLTVHGINMLFVLIFLT